MLLDGDSGQEIAPHQHLVHFPMWIALQRSRISLHLFTISRDSCPFQIQVADVPEVPSRGRGLLFSSVCGEAGSAANQQPPVSIRATYDFYIQSLATH